MTEDEAKTKACCGPRNNTMTAEDSDILCIGSACMAWRVQTIEAYQENVYNQPEKPEGDDWKPHSTGPRNVAWWRTIPERQVGHCGLAGSPS